MKSKIGRFIMLVVLGLGLLMPLNIASAEPLKDLSGQWWQWIYSLPSSVNPNLDTTGADCVVGQRGDIWFLAGNFGGAVTRTCSVPEGKVLFFPVVNSSFFNSPNTCGQGPESFSAKQMRAAVAPFIDGATNVSATLDGRPVKNIQRVRSEVFEVSLPASNVYEFFGVSCASGVYSPAIDDGYYVQLKPLGAGAHELNIHAEVPASGFVLDVTYNLTVVPVTLK